MARERSAGAVVYRITEDGNIVYLLLQPAPGKPWGYPKGKIDAGETEEQAARREIAEEAGLDEIDLDHGFRHSVHYVYRRGRVLVKKEVVYFIARAFTAEVRLSNEHVAFRWATFDDAETLVVYESARDILRQAHQHLARRYGLTTAD